jgi:phosphoglycolate phosphatase
MELINLMKKKLIIFDFDGTLLHSAPIIKKILNVLRARLDLSPLQEEDIYPWISEGGLKMITNSLCMSDDKAKDWVTEFRRIYMATKTDRKLIYTGAVQFIKFAKKYNYELAICSNKPEPLLIKALSDTGLLSFFPTVVGGTEKTKAKPNPERILKILEKVDADRNTTVMIGDSRADYEACANAEVDFIFFKGGYDDGVPMSKINHSFSRFSELMPIIKTKESAYFDKAN